MANIWLDDERNPVDFNFPMARTYWAQDYDTAVHLLTHEPDLARPNIISLDNDLGGTKEGYDFLKFIVEQAEISGINYWPREIRVHSANVVALENMRATIERYGPYPRSTNGWKWTLRQA